MEAISAKNLKKIYRGGIVLDGASLSAGSGDRVAIYGKTGAGKTTLLYILAGLMRPEGGTVELFGQEATANGSFLPPEERGVGMVFQKSLLWPHMTASGNVEFALWGLRLSGGQRRGRALRALEFFGVAELAGRRPETLSGGQAQRVALARSVAGGARILLWDEPFTGLDDETRAEVASRALGYMRENGTTLVMVSHRREDASLLDARIMTLEDGRLEKES